MTPGGLRAETEPSEDFRRQRFRAGLVATIRTGRRGEGDRVSLRRDQIFRFSLLGADLAAVTVAFGGLLAFTSHAPRVTWLSLLGLLGLFLGAKIAGLYDRDAVLVHKTTLDEAPKLFELATLGTLCAWLGGGYVVSGGNLDRSEVLMLWVVLIVFLVFDRFAARQLALRLTPTERCMFVGESAAARTIASKFEGRHHSLKADLVTSIDPADVMTWSADGLSAPRLREVGELARSLDIERAIVAPDGIEPQQMLDLMRTLEAIGIKISVLPRLLEVVGSSVEFDDLDGVTVMGVKRFALSRSSTAVKRAFDLVGALIGLLAVAPILIAIAIAIRLDSRGPVFFRQPRVGKHGIHFGVFKFRTMVPDAEALKDSLRNRNEAQAGLFKIADDPRVTRVGRILRKTALDELPQLLNIARGEMSLVGPRPLVADEDQHVTGWYRRRLELMPGMTGPWQILGPSRVPLQEMGTLDYLYVANWSLWGDVKLLLRTVPHVLGRRGL